MPTYSELLAQIAELQKQAEIARVNELQEAIAQIKAIMAQFDISLNDLGVIASHKQRKSSHVKAKYRDPVSGKEWSGRGVTPKWISDSGKSKEAFFIG